MFKYYTLYICYREPGIYVKHVVLLLNKLSNASLDIQLKLFIFQDVSDVLTDSDKLTNKYTLLVPSSDWEYCKKCNLTFLSDPLAS